MREQQDSGLPEKRDAQDTFIEQNSLPPVRDQDYPESVINVSSI
ncbi:MAG: hypothetical protein OXL96_12430 [Candidatus Poribacteria bacterium]|nr:hypothetical protein [Candidatus Poribacteria bacterium]